MKIVNFKRPILFVGYIPDSDELFLELRCGECEDVMVMRRIHDRELGIGPQSFPYRLESQHRTARHYFERHMQVGGECA